MTYFKNYSFSYASPSIKHLLAKNLMALAFAKTPALFELILLLCFRIIKGSVQQINAVYWWGEPELRGDIQGTFNSSPLKSCDQTVAKRNKTTLGVLWNPVGWMKSMEFKGWKKRKNKAIETRLYVRKLGLTPHSTEQWTKKWA